jgi:lipopolysaccharide transport system ATP-binding protein
MSNSVIQVEKLSKRFEIGERETHVTLRDAIARKFAAPFRANGKRGTEVLWALSDVSFEVKQGDVLGLIGRNGAGKSTLLKILSRITRPTIGWAKVRGRISSLLEVGTGFHPELTGRENVFLNGAILGMSKKELVQKFDEIVAFAEIERFIDTPVKRYSSGMYVRLAFAVAAHLDPDILLVDEVLAVGDLQFQKKCMGKMQDVSSKGRTIIFVSHSMNSVATLCQSAILLEKGKVLFHSDNVLDVVRRYTSPIEAAHTIDLSRHPNRISRTAAFQEISMVDEDRGPTHSFPPGAMVLIRLRVEPPNAIRSPRVSIGFTDARGERIFAIGTHIGGGIISSIDGPSTLCIRFTVPPLVPGEYTLDIGFYDRTGIPLDQIIGGAVMEVQRNGYLSMLDEHNVYTGHIMVRSEWTCTQDVQAGFGELRTTTRPRPTPPLSEDRSG